MIKKFIAAVALTVALAAPAAAQSQCHGRPNGCGKAVEESPITEQIGYRHIGPSHYRPGHWGGRGLRYGTIPLLGLGFALTPALTAGCIQQVPVYTPYGLEYHYTSICH